MNTHNLIAIIRRSVKGLFSIFMLLGCCSYIFSEDKDQEILNQLYNEIINNGNTQNLDSTGKPELSKPAISQKDLPTLNSDPVTEQLKTEIEKIVKETQLRHSDAVKFMQDTK